jgi:hypothetical protein
MEYPQKGGLLGMFLSEIGGKTLDKVKDFGSSLKEGITSALDDTPDEQADYAAKTFGFYPSDVHPESQEINTTNQDEINALKRQIMSNPGTTNFGNIELLYPEGTPGHLKANTFDPEQYILDNPPEIQTGIFPTDDVVEEVPAPEFKGEAPPWLHYEDDAVDPLPFDEGKEDYIRDQNEYRMAPLGSPDPHGDFPVTYPQDKPINTDMDNNKYYQDLTPEEIDFIFGRKDQIADEDMNVPPPIVPFDDTGRETGIASLYGQGPQWGETDRRYEDEYRDYTERMGDMVGGPMTYEEFARAYERMHQGKPHAGLR